MTYKVVVRNFTISNKWIRLNHILDGKLYDYRTKKYKNPIKIKGDSICIKAIKGQLKNVQIDRPVVIHYNFYAPDEWDADGIISAFLKCYLDGLQKANVIKGDSYKFVSYPRIDSYQIDRKDPRVETWIEVV